MKGIYVITMWSGGKPAKKWQSEGAPERLPTAASNFWPVASLVSRADFHAMPPR